MRAMRRQHGTVPTATPVAVGGGLAHHRRMDAPTTIDDSGARRHDLLIEAIAERADRAAFAELFGHFAPRLKAYLMRLGADPATAEEVVQDAMLTVWHKAAGFDRRQAGAATWIFTIARNRRIDRLRRERRPELEPDDPALVPAAQEDADAMVWTTQVEDRLRTAIAALPPEQSDLIRRAYFEDLSHREIAEASGLPLGTVKSRIRLALQRLRERTDDLA
jgi:RNA polymerase sigma-70 factor (ECF subfamily)